MAGKICPYCYTQFTPHPKVLDRQICCGRDFCKRERKKEADRKWRKQNPDYFKGRYPIHLKPWLEKHPGYLKEYRWRKKRVGIAGNNDIQDELSCVKTTSGRKVLSDIQDKLTSVNSMNYVVFSNLRDIQDELSTLGALPLKGSP